jgi:hypothetical protein
MENNDIGYVYESPDNGSTLYRRHFGEIERELVYKNDSDLFTFTAFNEIRKLAETNSSLKKALDNLLLIYYTIKDDKSTS